MANNKPKDNGEGKKNGQDSDPRVKYGNTNFERGRGTKCKKRDFDNDASWYAANPQLLSDSASLSYSWPLGSRVPLWQDFDQVFPGILTFSVAMTPGYSDGPTAPVTIAARNIYSFVRHANSGHANYDSPDLMLYLLAMDNAYAYLAWLKRIYGQAQLYTTNNRYYPRALIQAQGVDFDDVMRNLANFRYYINQMVIKIASMCIPKSMPYMARHEWMFSHYYVDNADSSKAQTYMYVPAGFWEFYEQGPNGGRLDWYPTSTGTDWKVEDLIIMGDQLLNPILESEDMNIMSGDILKAFTAEGIYQVSMIPEDYIELPQYSSEVLYQMHNATVLPKNLTTDSTWQVGQVSDPDLGGYIAFTPSASINDPVNTVPMYRGSMDYRRLINFYHDDVTPAETMVATRLTCIPEVTPGDPGSSSRLLLTDCGSEICVGLQIWSITYTAGAEGAVSPMLNDFQYDMRSLTQSHTVMTLLDNFDWHPAFVFNTVAGGSVSSRELFMDVCTYSVIGHHELAKMNATALLSEFNVPQMGLFARK